MLTEDCWDDELCCYSDAVIPFQVLVERYRIVLDSWSLQKDPMDRLAGRRAACDLQEALRLLNTSYFPSLTAR